MRKVIVLAAVTLLTGGALMAQEGGAAPQGGRGGRGMGGQTITPPTCPANGYGAQAYYGVFGQNGGDGNTAYEVASPCIGKDVREVAESIGMGRNTVLGVKNVIGVQFKADGTMADGAGMAKLTNAEFQIAYYIPAMRAMLNGTKANGQPLKEIRVFADQYAWNEAQEGRGATAATNTLNDRLPLIKLTPFGALWSVIEAEGHTVVTKTADGKTVLTGTSPYDGIEVAVTVEDSKQHAKLGPYGTDRVDSSSGRGDREGERPRVRGDVRRLSRRPRAERLDDFPDADQVDAGRQAARRSEGDVLPFQSVHRVSHPRCREAEIIELDHSHSGERTRTPWSRRLSSHPPPRWRC